MTGDGALKPSQNQTYIKMIVSGPIVEVLQLSASESYTRQGGRGHLDRRSSRPDPAESALQPVISFRPGKIWPAVPESAYAGTETVDGILCDRVTFSFNLQEILGQTLSALTAEQLAAITGSGTGEIAVAQSDGLPRQMIMNMSFTIAGANATLQGTEAVVTMEMKYSGYGEPVEMPTVE